MELSIRPKVYTLPSYSLTSDLLGYLRCGLQYRYTAIGQLPPARPVQMWFGQFIHGVLEEAYRRYHRSLQEGAPILPPWPPEALDEILQFVKRRLASGGLFPWTEELEALGNARARMAVNELGPELFPLIHRAEVRLTGARILPVEQIPPQYRYREADRYEISGVIDVITHIELGDPTLQNNQLVRAILDALPGSTPDEFEVIIDYKGMRRPPLQIPAAGMPDYWQIYAWQVQTYAHLRSWQEDSLPVVAGILIYLNELLPTRSDLLALRQEVQRATTDVPVDSLDEVAATLLAWDERTEDPPVLPLAFRLRRALRVIPVTLESIQQALQAFDQVVAQIETCRGREVQSGRVIASWEANPADEGTCAACDSRTYCPSYASEQAPRLPAVRAGT